MTRFQSTLSLRRATLTGSLPMTIPTISIHALLAESDPPLPPAGGGRQISIHALLAESDLRSCFPLCRSGHFNPRSPCGERHCLLCFCASTAWNFNPRSPCGERPPGGCRLGFPPGISIHALLAESDITARRRERKHDNFNPRSPCGERRQVPPGLNRRLDISIHALLAESDSPTADLERR